MRVSLFSCLSRLAPSVTRVCILARFVRRTKKKERLLVVYKLRLSRSIQFKHLTSSFVSLTEGRFSEHQNSVVQISCCRKLIVM